MEFRIFTKNNDNDTIYFKLEKYRDHIILLACDKNGKPYVRGNILRIMPSSN